jgi:hypothetical protein
MDLFKLTLLYPVPHTSKLINLRVILKVMIIVDAQLVDAYAHGFTHFALFDSSLIANGFSQIHFVLSMAPTEVS